MSQTNHIIEQDQDGMMETIKNIFLVVQHQPESPEYDNTTIYTYSSREEAEECAKRLNLEYAKGVVLDENGQFMFVVNEEEDTCHYYEVVSSLLETEVDDEVYDPAKDKNDPESNVYVIALYEDESGKFAGFYANPEPTLDKDAATYYNENTVEYVAQAIEEEGNYSTEIFHYTKADKA